MQQKPAGEQIDPTYKMIEEIFEKHQDVFMKMLEKRFAAKTNQNKTCVQSKNISPKVNQKGLGVDAITTHGEVQSEKHNIKANGKQNAHIQGKIENDFKMVQKAQSYISLDIDVSMDYDPI